VQTRGKYSSGYKCKCFDEGGYGRRGKDKDIEVEDLADWLMDVKAGLSENDATVNVLMEVLVTSS